MRPATLPVLNADPLVSVLIANFNYARFLDKALQSVVDQTWTNLEIVVCDDGSTDDSVDVLRRWEKRDARVKVLTQPNAGHAAATNATFRASNGDVVALLDSDDWWTPTKLDRSLDAFRALPQVGYLTHAFTVVDAEGRRLFRRSAPRFPQGGWLGPLLASGWRRDIGSASAMVARREVANEVFDLPVTLRAYVDRLFAERCAIVARVAVLDEALGFYRLHGDNNTGAEDLLRDASVTERTLAFYEVLAADRANFIHRIHGTHVDPDDIQAVLSAEVELRLKLLRGQRATFAEIRDKAPTRFRFLVWTVLFAFPFRSGAQVLRMWRNANMIFRLRYRRRGMFRGGRSGRGV
jgi:glycosyltransferase involved in cell wall biosynthesis